MSDSTPISNKFLELKKQNQMAFMPFVTCGDPDMAMTLSVIQELSNKGVDLIEVGFPYSDPIADGPVIQASYTRSLEKGLKVQDIFKAIGSLEKADTPPLVAMVAYSIIYRFGTDKFLKEASESGFSGLIIPDLPGDEASEIAEKVKSYQLDLIQLIAPTTPDHRVKKILKSASGFLYCISVAGTTGVRSELPEELNQQLSELKKLTDLPLAIGFGISKPEHVDKLRGKGDGIIVGSAIVKQLENISSDSNSRNEVLEKIGKLAEELVNACHQ